MKHQGTKVLETGCLRLRPFKIEDAKGMYNNWSSDPKVTQYLRLPISKNLRTTRRMIENWISRYSEDNWYHWAIVLKSEGDEPIGSITVADQNDRLEMVHMAYCIGRKWWDQGITTEALGILIEFFFKKVGVNRIESQHDVRNIGSGKVDGEMWLEIRRDKA